MMPLQDVITSEDTKNTILPQSLQYLERTQSKRKN